MNYRLIVISLYILVIIFVRCESKLIRNYSNLIAHSLYITWLEVLESVKALLTSKSQQLFSDSVNVLLNRELARFIASGRLHCRIDKVAGVVETNRPDSKNFLYQVHKTIKINSQLSSLFLVYYQTR